LTLNLTTKQALTKSKASSI